MPAHYVLQYARSYADFAGYIKLKRAILVPEPIKLVGHNIPEIHITGIQTERDKFVDYLLTKKMIYAVSD